ncbi:MAG TPA: MetQ/NlpA family ABC transporter substrate-binding protein [Vineibacter sp.]|nr:MetQ/NlpA family ABC transporter substrate-binding protein [Vineibacter sp.]
MFSHRIRAGIAAAVLALSPVVTQAADPQTIRVGVTAGPHAEILDVVKKVGAERGVAIKVVEFTDYVIPNQALAQGETEANSFQHEPYLKNQIGKTNWKIVKVADTIASPMGFYSRKYKSFADVPAGATLAIQNDPTNGARSLHILHANGFIKLRDPSNVVASVADIVENPRRFRFIELDAAQIPRSLPDVDAASINNNYAVQAGLDPVNDTLIKEAANGPWVNIIAVRAEDKDKPWVAQLVSVYHSDPVRQFVLTRFKGAYQPAW